MRSIARWQQGLAAAKLPLHSKNCRCQASTIRAVLAPLFALAVLNWFYCAAESADKDLDEWLLETEKGTETDKVRCARWAASPNLPPVCMCPCHLVHSNDGGH